MIPRPHRITFRLSEAENAALKMLSYATRTHKDSKVLRLLIQIGCEAVRCDLSAEQLEKVVTSFSSNSIMERYRIQSLAGKTQTPKKVPSSAGCGKLFKPADLSDKSLAGGAKKKQKYRAK